MEETLEKDTKILLDIIRSLDRKSLELLWEAFLFSPQADVPEDRIDALALYKRLKQLIKLADYEKN